MRFGANKSELSHNLCQTSVVVIGVYITALFAYRAYVNIYFVSVRSEFGNKIDIIVMHGHAYADREFCLLARLVKNYPVLVQFPEY